MELLTFITPLHLALIPITVGLVEVVKRGGLPVRYAPVVAVVFGVAGSFSIGGAITEVILGGIVVGLSAAGLYSGTSAVKNG